MNSSRGRRHNEALVVGTTLIIACMLVACGSSSPVSSAASNDFFIPSAAFSNGLGNFPATAECSGSLPGGVVQPLPFVAFTLPNLTPCPAGDTGTGALQYNQPAAQPGLGVPLGGVGAGSFMINQAGSFGPWNFGGVNENANGPNTQYENRILPQAAFHVREQLGDGAATVTTLAVNAAPWNQLPTAWNPLKAGDGTYYALWPFGWEKFNTFSAGVSMRFWSPIVAGEDKMTSMPIAYFDVHIANTTTKTDKVSVMFTFPNAAEHDAITVRTGLSSKVQTSSGDTKVTGVTLSASDPSNTPDAQDSEWTIAAMPGVGQQLSYVTSWNASGDGSDIYQAFSKSGQLPNKALDQSSSAGAIAVSVTLAPGESVVVPFALTWDFPKTTVPASNCSSGLIPSSCESWSDDPTQYFMRRYTSFFGGQETTTNDYVKGTYPFHQSFAVADQMLHDHDSALSKVQDWWIKIATNPAYPDWLVREGLNEEIQMVFSSSFWESGKITDTPSTTSRIGAAIPGTHLFCTITGGNWNSCNEWDTDAAGYLAELLLWPNLERDRLRGVVQEILQGVEGVHETGLLVNPITDSLTPLVGNLQFSDIPNETIFRCYAYYRRTGDTEFLKYAYPAMLKQLQLLQGGIHAPDHLPLDLPGQEDSYDVLHAEIHNIYNSELFLLTEEIMIDATQKARALGVAEATTDIQQQLQSDLPLAKQEFESIFWDPLLGKYKIDPLGQYVDGYFVASFYAQNVAITLGLPSLVPLEHEIQHMVNAYPIQMQMSYNGHLLGPPNVVPGIGPINTVMQPIEEQEVWPGIAMMYAGSFIQAGQAANDQSVINMGLTMAHSLEYWMAEYVPLGFLFEEPGAWMWDTPTIYRSPSFNQERTTLGVLNTISPIVHWAVPPPSADLYNN